MWRYGGIAYSCEVTVLMFATKADSNNRLNKIGYRSGRFTEQEKMRSEANKVTHTSRLKYGRRVRIVRSNFATIQCASLL